MKSCINSGTLINILLVTGYSNDALQIKELLRSVSFRFAVHHCSGLKDTLKYLSSSTSVRPDIIFMDLNLPDSSGIETLHQIKQQYQEIPVIVMGNNKDEKVLSLAVQHGAEEVLLKDRLNVNDLNRSLHYISGCSERVLELQKKFDHQFNVLSAATTAISECEDPLSVYKTICTNVRKLHDDLMVIAFTIEYNGPKIIRPVFSEGLEPYSSIARSLSGLNLSQLEFPLNDYSPQIIDLYRDGKIHELKGGIYDISRGKYKKKVSAALEKLLGIHKMYAIGFSRDLKYYGGLLLLSKSDIGNEEKSIIEAICSQGSLNIQRKIAEKELKKSEKRYKNFFIQAPIPNWEKDYSEIKKEIEKIKAAGVVDLLKYFENNPRKVKEWINKVHVTDLNPAVLEFYNAGSKEQLLEKLPLLTSKETIKGYREEFMHIFYNQTKFEVEREELTIGGEAKRILLRWSAAEGYEDTLERVFVSVIDTSEIKKAEKTLQKLNERLETKIQERTKDLKALNCLLENELEERKLAENALLESEEKYRALFNKMVDGFALHKIILDENGKPCNYIFLEVNHAFEKLIGMKAEDIIGKTILEIDPLTENFWIETFGNVALTGQNVNFERFTTLSKRFCRLSAYSHKHGYFAVIYEDITYRKQAEQALSQNEEKFRMLTENSNALISEIDSQGNFRYVNSKYRENLGYEPEDLVGLPASEICHHDMKDAFIRMLGQSLVTLEPQHNEWKLKDKSGIWRYFDCYSNTIINSKGEPSISLVAFDITDKKAVEEQLKKFVADLKHLNATKDKFFRIIAHDLKNPFSILLGASEILVNNLDDYEVNSIKEFGKMINNAAKSGYALLENLLEWARAQTGNITFDPQPLNITDAVCENISNMLVYAHGKNLNLHSLIQGEIFVRADRNMLNTILRNLISNAIKFTPEGGEISVYTQQEDKFVTIAVKDSGIGIEEDDVDKLFRIDVKYTNKGTAQEGGTGLGLILCREFVEKHNGKIWVTSIPGKGSEFKFSLPIAP